MFFISVIIKLAIIIFLFIQTFNYDSLADFYCKDGVIELRLPWSILNFYDPSLMMIHNDYYEKYGVAELALDRIYIGAGLEKDRTRIHLLPFKPKKIILFGSQANKLDADREVPKWVKVLFLILAIAFIAGVLYLCWRLSE